MNWHIDRLNDINKMRIRMYNRNDQSVKFDPGSYVQLKEKLVLNNTVLPPYIEGKVLRVDNHGNLTVDFGDYGVQVLTEQTAIDYLTKYNKSSIVESVRRIMTVKPSRKEKLFPGDMVRDQTGSRYVVERTDPFSRRVVAISESGNLRLFNSTDLTKINEVSQSTGGIPPGTPIPPGTGEEGENQPPHAQASHSQTVPLGPGTKVTVVGVDPTYNMWRLYPVLQGEAEGMTGQEGVIEFAYYPTGLGLTMYRVLFPRGGKRDFCQHELTPSYDDNYNVVQKTGMSVDMTGQVNNESISANVRVGSVVAYGNKKGVIAELSADGTARVALDEGSFINVPLGGLRIQCGSCNDFARLTSRFCGQCGCNLTEQQPPNAPNTADMQQFLSGVVGTAAGNPTVTSLQAMAAAAAANADQANRLICPNCQCGCDAQGRCLQCGQVVGQDGGQDQQKQQLKDIGSFTAGRFGYSSASTGFGGRYTPARIESVERNNDQDKRLVESIMLGRIPAVGVVAPSGRYSIPLKEGDFYEGQTVEVNGKEGIIIGIVDPENRAARVKMTSGEEVLVTLPPLSENAGNSNNSQPKQSVEINTKEFTRALARSLKSP